MTSNSFFFVLHAGGECPTRLISLEEPENSPVLRVEPCNSFEKREMVAPPGEVRLPKQKPHSSELRDVLVSPVECPDLDPSFFEGAIPPKHVVEKHLLLLEEKQVDRSPTIGDLLEVRAFLPEDPIEKREIHIRQVIVKVLEFCSFDVTTT
jgi:hypothetical protein